MKSSRDFSIGIMQGRLTPPRGRGIQFFPFDGWEEEFVESAKLGLPEIEFIFDEERWRENPLMNKEGTRRIKNLTEKTGVRVNRICADYFMRKPFFHVEESVRKENIILLKTLIEAASEVGAKSIEIPILDNSSIKNAEEKKSFIASIKECLPYAKEKNIRISVESDLAPYELLLLVNGFGGAVGAVYDSGNSASLGYDPGEEIWTLGSYIDNVHIKDRIKGGGTVALGSGNADFEAIFRSLKDIKYNGGFIIQAARGDEGDEQAAVGGQKQFINSYINKYLNING